MNDPEDLQEDCIDRLLELQCVSYGAIFSNKAGAIGQVCCVDDGMAALQEALWICLWVGAEKEQIFQLYMLGVAMKYWVYSHVHALILSQCKIVGWGRWMPRSWSKKESQVSSTAVGAIDRYSASTLERATFGYFLALQDTQLLPRNVQKQVVEWRVGIEEGV